MYEICPQWLRCLVGRHDLKTKLSGIHDPDRSRALLFEQEYCKHCSYKSPKKVLGQVRSKKRERAHRKSGKVSS